MPSAAPNPAVQSARSAPLFHNISVLGLFLFAVFAPHSIAGAEISLAIAAAGWIFRALVTRRAGFHRSRLDFPILLFLVWTVASALLSVEPRISVAKLQSIHVFLTFYLTQAVATRRTAVLMVALMILSGVAGTFFSVYDLARGRGVVVAALAPDSPFRKIEARAGNSDTAPETSLSKGDTIWRVGGEKIYSAQELDEVIRRAPVNQLLSVSVITHGEHAEWPGILATQRLRDAASPSGVQGAARSHRFRASGWTKHYEYFAEILQILSQLALGLALANFQNHGANRRFKLALLATGILAFGIAFTAMRTVLVAFAIGGCVVVWRTAKGAASRFLVTAAIVFIFSFGVVVIWQTRATHSLSLQDDSASLRMRVARVGLERVWLHPVFGHGMDAVKNHWTEWGFPGAELIHLHSTPLQLAFDRGLPALVFWLWLMFAFWRQVTGGELATRDTGDTNRHGVLLGATGALAGFFVSSIVNYNFGAGIVALVFWWLMGITVALSRDVRWD
jgi:O-Antigen ligase